MPAARSVAWLAVAIALGASSSASSAVMAGTPDQRDGGAAIISPGCGVPESGLSPRERSDVYPRGPYERWRTRFLLRQSAKAACRASSAPWAEGDWFVMKDVPYGPHCCQCLDLYLPGCRCYPVVLYVHGGSWIGEDKAMYEAVGRCLAAHGVGAVLVNYRLPPAADCQGELRDVARAFAWVQASIGGLGGDPERIFLCGHSAGGHLVSVLATNPQYLREQGLSPACVRGVIAVSGAYRVSLNLRLFGVAYVFQGLDKRDLSPIRGVCPCPPPVLLINAQHDSRVLKLQARRFEKTLRKAGGDTGRYVVPDEDHYGQLFELAAPGAPQCQRILDFISSH